MVFAPRFRMNVKPMIKVVDARTVMKGSIFPTPFVSPTIHCAQNQMKMENAQNVTRITL